MEVYEYGNPAADCILIQMVDDHDLEFIEREVDAIKREMDAISRGVDATARGDFRLIAIQVGGIRIYRRGRLLPFLEKKILATERVIHLWKFCHTVRMKQKRITSADIRWQHYLRYGQHTRRTSLAELRRHRHPSGSRGLLII